jgi:integrase
MAFVTAPMERIVGLMNRLTADEVADLDVGRRAYDGGGLWVRRTGRGLRWTFRFTLLGTNAEMTLAHPIAANGTRQDLSLTEARHAADAARATVKAGIDPRPPRKPVSPAGPAVTEPPPSDPRLAALVFTTFAEKQVALQERGWRNPSTAQKWRALLRRAVSLPPVDTITHGDMVALLTPLWARQPKLADDLRRRIEFVLNAAIALGHRQTNPAAWTTLKYEFTAAHDLQPVQHRRAVPHAAIATFYQALGEDVLGQCLRFQVLTATRPVEPTAMRWGSVDLNKALWTVPMSKNAAGLKIPLPQPAMAILRDRPPGEPNELVFGFNGPRIKGLRKIHPQQRAERMRTVDPHNRWTAHGFRATFRTWGQEHDPGFEHDALEMCLGHLRGGDETVKAYARSDLIAKRRVILDTWAAYVTQPVVIEVRQRRADNP